VRIPQTIRELVLAESRTEPVLPWDPSAVHQTLPRGQQPQQPMPRPETYVQRADRIGTPSPSPKPWAGVQPQTPVQDPSLTQKAWQAANKPYYIDDLAKSFVGHLRTAPQKAWEMLKRLNSSMTPAEFEQLKAVIKKHNI